MLELANEIVDGFILNYPGQVYRLKDKPIVLARQQREGQVALLSGGGCGHEPSHIGMVGYRMLTAALAGPLFTSPSAGLVSEAIQAADQGAGVLLLIKNYAGDVMNFRLAAEQVQEIGVSSAEVVMADDISISKLGKNQGRRGLAGILFLHKILGYFASQGANLQELQSMGQEIANRTISYGVAWQHASSLKDLTGERTIPKGYYEAGVGIHGERGVETLTFKGREEQMMVVLERLLEELEGPSRELALLVNGLGGLTPSALWYRSKWFKEELEARNYKLSFIKSGNLMTSLDTKGFSISLLPLEKPWLEALEAKVDIPAW